MKHYLETFMDVLLRKWELPLLIYYLLLITYYFHLKVYL